MSALIALTDANGEALFVVDAGTYTGSIRRAAGYPAEPSQQIVVVDLQTTVATMTLTAAAAEKWGRWRERFA